MKRKTICLLLAACFLAVCLAGCHKHAWTEATCTQPKTCAECGETEGEPLGHDRKDATCTEPAVCTVCGEVLGEALGHKAEKATCTEPSVCSVCGETVKEAFGHKMLKATCTEPAVCMVCGVTEGKALGHELSAATHASPAVCSVCGTQVGGMLPYAEEFGLSFITTRDFTVPICTYLSSGTENVDESEKLRITGGYTATAEDGVYHLEEITVSAPDADGNVKVTIPFTFDSKVRVEYDGVKEGGSFHVWWQYSIFDLFDYYSGSTIPFPSGNAKDDDITSEVAFSFDGKTVAVSCTKSSDQFSNESSSWKDLAGGKKENYFTSKTRYTLTVTMPKDYDGLCLSLTKLGITKKEDNSDKGKEAKPLLEAVEHGETADDLYLLRVKDLIG